MAKNDRKIKFQLTFPENQKKDANLFAIERFAFDDLGDFIEERQKISRTLERALETNLRVDYSDFSNHVFFDSAVAKFTIASNRVLTRYPFNGTLLEKENFRLTGSGYDDYIFDNWPRSVGYVHLSGTNQQFISASDTDNKLLLSSASLYVSAWVEPNIQDENIILQVGSGTVGASAVRQGYDFYLSGASDPYIKFKLFSGSSVASVSASFSQFTGSFNNVAVIYDNAADLLSIYINKERKASGTVAFGPITFKPSNLVVGSGSKFTTTAASGAYSFYSGSLDEVRIFHTASELFHQKNFDRPVDSEPYLKLNYRFNEGITESGSVDQVVVDYSKSSLHGILYNYESSARVSASVMAQDPGDPILYSFHSNVVAFSASNSLSASLYDNNNNNFIFNMIPEAILIEDELAEGLLESFVLAVARYFDDVKLYIDQFDNLRVTNYDKIDETPDQFLPFLKRYFGWKVTEHFGDADPLSFFFGEGVLPSGSLEVPLIDIKNQFWRRILNNLPYLMKTKGKRHNLDAFFNVIGIGKENINLKEYGYLPGSSIQDERINKQLVTPLLGIGTGSSGLLFTSSFVETPEFMPLSSSGYEFTVETMVQLPFPSSSYTNTVNSGSLWTLTGSSGFVSLYWVRNDLTAFNGKFVLSSSAPSSFSSSDLTIFDGEIVHVAAGRDPNDIPFISFRGIEGCDIVLSEDFTGSATFSTPTTDTYKLVMGAQSASLGLGTQGFFAEYRVWDKKLSGSELDDHALDHLSIGVKNPLDKPNRLLGHWPLDEDKVTNVSGNIETVKDLSRNGLVATGSNFPATENAYQRFLKDVNYNSPTMDLKWTDNKIRIRNTTELKFDEQANDTNEVSLEFNLVDSLNRDISKIFSTFDIINNLVGSPVNKYRDEYSDLEGIRAQYFERLGDSLNFTNFFKLFRWFDRKLSDSIKQLLPSRVRFIGGEQVVESHFLERSKYSYKYPIFRTPQEVPEIPVEASGVIAGSKMLDVDVDTFNLEKVRDTRDIHNLDDVIDVTPVGISRIQSGSSFITSGFTLSFTLPQTPVPGNTLIAVIGSQGNLPSDVTSIDSNGGQTWVKTIDGIHSFGHKTEIWYTTDVAEGSTADIDINFGNSLNDKWAIVAEYEGVLQDVSLLQGAPASVSAGSGPFTVGCGSPGTPLSASTLTIAGFHNETFPGANEHVLLDLTFMEGFTNVDEVGTSTSQRVSMWESGSVNQSPVVEPLPQLSGNSPSINRWQNAIAIFALAPESSTTSSFADKLPVENRDSIINVESDCFCTPVSKYGDGVSRYYRNSTPSDPPHKFEIQQFSGFGASGFQDVPFAVAVNESGTLFVGILEASNTSSRPKLRASSSHGGWNTISFDQSLYENFHSNDVDVAHNGIYSLYADRRQGMLLVGTAAGTSTSNDQSWRIFSSSDSENSASLHLVESDPLGAIDVGSTINSIRENPHVEGNYFAAGTVVDTNTAHAWEVFSASFDTLTSWVEVDSYFTGAYAKNVMSVFPATNTSGVFAPGALDRSVATTNFEHAVLRASFSGGHPGTWETVLDWENSGTNPSRFEDVCESIVHNRLYLVGGDFRGGFVLESTDGGHNWSEKLLNTDVDTYRSCLTIRNSFEEYLVLAGGNRDNVTNAVLQVIKISDDKLQNTGFEPQTILTGTIWDLASFENKVYYTFSEDYAGNPVATLPEMDKLDNTTGGYGIVSIPADNQPRPNFYPIKVSGDTRDAFNDPNLGINFKNVFEREILRNKDKDNKG